MFPSFETFQFYQFFFLTKDLLFLFFVQVKQGQDIHIDRDRCSVLRSVGQQEILILHTKKHKLCWKQTEKSQRNQYCITPTWLSRDLSLCNKNKAVQQVHTKQPYVSSVYLTRDIQTKLCVITFSHTLHLNSQMKPWDLEKKIKKESKHSSVKYSQLTWTAKHPQNKCLHANPPTYLLVFVLKPRRQVKKLLLISVM